MAAEQNTDSEAADAFDQLTDGLDARMFIVTGASAHDRAGCLVGFAAQASIDPRRFLVSISKSNHTHEVAASTEYLAVHAITREHSNLAELFGGETGDTTDKFARCRWSEGVHGVPILTDPPIWFVGQVLGRFDFGDHTGYLLGPVDGGVRTADTPADAWFTLADADDIEPGHPA